MIKVTIRAKSSGPHRRAGLVMLPLGQWVQGHVTRNAEGARKLLGLVEDPKVTVEFGLPKGDPTGNWLEDYTWEPAPSADEVRAMIASLADEPEEEDEPESFVSELNTQLPTAEPTLERDASEIDPQAKTPENPADQGNAAEELTPAPPPVVNDTSSSTPAPEVLAPVAVEEAAPAAKTETKPAPKAHKPKA